MAITCDGLDSLQFEVAKLDDYDFGELKSWFQSVEIPRRKLAVVNAEKKKHTKAIKKLRVGHKVRLVSPIFHRNQCKIGLGETVKIHKTKGMRTKLEIEHPKTGDIWIIPFHFVEDIPL